jgi:hypothetical protein
VAKVRHSAAISDPTAHWLKVIAKEIAFSMMRQEPEKYKTVANQAPFLEALGFDNEDITSMTGTSPQVVANALSAARKRSKKRT